MASDSDCECRYSDDPNLCPECGHDDQSAGKHKDTTDASYRTLTYGCNEQNPDCNSYCNCKNEFHFRASATNIGRLRTRVRESVEERSGWVKLAATREEGRLQSRQEELEREVEIANGKIRKLMAEYDAQQASPQLAGAPEQIPIYVASRASIPERGIMWRKFRSEGVNITSSWIDEDGAGQTGDWRELWERIANEISDSAALVLYAERDDFPLKGAFIEVGIAIGLGIPVIACLPGVVPDQNWRPIGSWINHPLVSHVDDINEAVKLATTLRASHREGRGIMAETDKEFADRLDAEDRLRNRGYEKITCPRCQGGFGGVGQIQPDIVCWNCEGKGYIWQAPITK